MAKWNSIETGVPSGSVADVTSTTSSNSSATIERAKALPVFRSGPLPAFSSVA